MFCLDVFSISTVYLIIYLFAYIRERYTLNVLQSCEAKLTGEGNLCDCFIKTLIKDYIKYSMIIFTDLDFQLLNYFVHSLKKTNEKYRTFFFLYYH